ncbi:hypothetical protein [Halorubrum trapanicum]|uniref:hypothetical protein n=1 Tax=Halorubrum trapanicum TaxID=29284 RepID=UPI003C7017EE
MVDDPRDATDARDALAEAFEEPAARPVATRTRVPPSADRDPDGDSADPVDDETDGGDPIYPQTRAP